MLRTVVFALVLLSFIYLFSVSAQEIDRVYNMDVLDPSGNIVTGCNITIAPEECANCHRTTSASCERQVKCEKRGNYTAIIKGYCHTEGETTRQSVVLSCDYDDCEQCCTYNTTYKWDANWNQINRCCGDDWNEYYQKADVGDLDLCCSGRSDCAVNGKCLAAGEKIGNYCCYNSSNIDSMNLSCQEYVYNEGQYCHHASKVCARNAGWACKYWTDVCTMDMDNECTSLCGNKVCQYSDNGYYNWSILPERETSCNDQHDNDCDGAIDEKDVDCKGIKVFYGRKVMIPSFSEHGMFYEFFLDSKTALQGIY